jgi:hypothetical protein
MKKALPLIAGIDATRRGRSADGCACSNHGHCLQVPVPPRRWRRRSGNGSNMKRVILPMIALLAMPAPANAGAEAVPMVVGRGGALVCDQLVVAKVVAELLKQAAFESISKIKNCVMLHAGDRLSVLGVAPGGFVYVIRPPDDAHGAWTHNEWLRKVK